MRRSGGSRYSSVVDAILLVFELAMLVLGAALAVNGFKNHSSFFDGFGLGVGIMLLRDAVNALARRAARLLGRRNLRPG